MNKETKKKEWYIIVPEIYVISLMKQKRQPINIISLEGLIKLGELLGITPKEILTDYILIAATLVYGSQLKLSCRLIIDKTDRNSSTEKTFQQTCSHYNITRILSNSDSAKRLQAMYAIQIGIDLDAFGNNEEERTSEGFENVINGTYTELIEKRGSGSSKVSVKNPETRADALRAKVASLRSKWCSTPTYAYNKVCSTGISIKNLNSQDVLNYFEKLGKILVEAEIVNEEAIPTQGEILEIIKGTISDLDISTQVDDSDWGTFNTIPIEETMFGITRISNNITISKEPLPDFISQLKSSKNNLKKPKKESK